MTHVRQRVPGTSATTHVRQRASGTSMDATDD